MKVNTDGILLGAWSLVAGRKRILDIGTGTGLIALMLAQRSQTDGACIDAIELDPDATKQAIANVQASPWNARINVQQQDVLQYNNGSEPYDLLVCNPPYFVDSLKAPDTKRRLARHTDSLDFNQLILKATELACDNADFCLILPIVEAKRFIDLSHGSGWQLSAICVVSHNESKPPFRYLMRFTKSNAKCETQHTSLIIRGPNNQYSHDYIALCRDFYLKM